MKLTLLGRDFSFVEIEEASKTIISRIVLPALGVGVIGIRKGLILSSITMHASTKPTEQNPISYPVQSAKYTIEQSPFGSKDETRTLEKISGNEEEIFAANSRPRKLSSHDSPFYFRLRSLPSFRILVDYRLLSYRTSTQMVPFKLGSL